MKEEITIIDNYKDLLLGDYMEIVALSRDESLDELEKQVKILSILTGLTEDELLNLPITEYQVLSSKLAFLAQALPDNAQRLANSYRVGKFDLVPVTDMRKVIAAQYIDFQSFHQAGMEDHFAEILSCLLVPNGEKYNQGYDILEVQDAIRKNLSVYDSMTIYSFFALSCRESIKDMLIFSLQEAENIKDLNKKKEMVRQIQEQMSLLGINGDGSQM